MAGGAVWLPEGAAKVNNLVLPVVLFPLLWTADLLVRMPGQEAHARLRRDGRAVRRERRAHRVASDEVNEMPAMLKLPQSDTKALLAIHGWSGVLLGLLLYVVICTGVAAVFAEEINDWASPLPHASSPGSFPAGIDAVTRKLATQVDPQFHEEIAMFRSAGGRLNLRYHLHDTMPNGKPGERGVEFEVDPATWQPLARRAGWDDEIAEQTKPSGVAAFLINLHVRLHIPEPCGLFVTGVLGLAMMIAAVTGILVHRHLLADLFTLRLGTDALLKRRDLHVVAGSWNLPFALILAFTGSFFSFASSVGLPAIAMVTFGGNQAALIDTLYSTARPENTAPAPLGEHRNHARGRASPKQR